MILGTGIDIIEIDRIRKSIDKWGDNFLNHVFLQEEIAYARKHKNAAQHFAARFAAKEAVYKALNDKSISWKDIKIINDADGKPHCIIMKENHDHHKILISLSHSENYAIANAIISN